MPSGSSQDSQARMSDQRSSAVGSFLGLSGDTQRAGIRRDGFFARKRRSRAPSFDGQRNEISIKTAHKDGKNADFGIKIAIISEINIIFAPEWHEKKVVTMAVDRIQLPQERYLWAIQRAGMNLDTYQRKYPKSSVGKWIDEEKMPTLKQLEDFAKQVKVPFGYLFLEHAPHEEIPFPVFRGEAGQREGFDLDVFDTVNGVRQRQEWLSDYLVENEIPVCEIVGVVSLRTSIAETVGILRRKLQLDARWAFELASDAAAVSKMTEQLENAGVFVTFNGIVGNNTHRPLDVKECRGFALVDRTAPFIFVNSQDAKKAQLFTLVHEAAHIMLGVSAGHAETLTLSHDATERYCDLVAAEFLVPAMVLRELWDGDLKKLSRRFWVSELVIARRAHDLGLMSDNDYRNFWQEYSHRPHSQKREGKGGNYYRSSLKRVGKLFAIHVRNAVNSSQLSYTEAYRLTGLKGQTYDVFMNNNI